MVRIAKILTPNGLTPVVDDFTEISVRDGVFRIGFLCGDIVFPFALPLPLALVGLSRATEALTGSAIHVFAARGGKKNRH